MKLHQNDYISIINAEKKNTSNIIYGCLQDSHENISDILPRQLHEERLGILGNWDVKLPNICKWTCTLLHRIGENRRGGKDNKLELEAWYSLFLAFELGWKHFRTCNTLNDDGSIVIMISI